MIHKRITSHFTFYGKKFRPFTNHEDILYHPPTSWDFFCWWLHDETSDEIIKSTILDPRFFLAFSLPETNKLISANGKLIKKWQRKKNKYYFCNPLRANWGKNRRNLPNKTNLARPSIAISKDAGRHFSHIEIPRDINKQPLKLSADHRANTLFKFRTIRNLWWKREASCPTLHVQG